MTPHSNTNSSSAPRLARARTIASRFDLSAPLNVSDFADKGNINQETYLVSTVAQSGCSEYLLQLLNPEIFTDPQAVMEGMIHCIRAQQEAMSEGIQSGEDWETIRLVPTRDGEDYLEISTERGKECWRMMKKISNTFTYKSLQEIHNAGRRLRVAEEAGRGLAFFGNLAAKMDTSKTGTPLPGYRDTENYYNQLLAILAGCRSLDQAEQFLPRDPLVRKSTEKFFLVSCGTPEYNRRLNDPQLRPCIGIALEQQVFGLALSRKLKSGELSRTVVHGDTKLDNFLFSTQTGKVKALVDLDTIMAHTWLSDWGDMVRSLINIAGERERDLEKIDADQEIFGALVKGFLTSARQAKPGEVELMVDAAEIMALELGVRFLADYLRGDVYFRLKPGDPQDLNKVRAMVQFSLFKRLRAHADAFGKIVRLFYH
jgi:N-acetylhexosamine 1-kinase